MSFTWQLITFCLETSGVSLLPFSIALCSQLAILLDAQRFCRLCVTAFSTDSIQTGIQNICGLACGHQVWTRWSRLISPYFSLQPQQWTLVITQGATKGQVWQGQEWGELARDPGSRGPQIYRHLRTAPPNRRGCPSPGTSQATPHSNRRQTRDAHSFCRLN